MTRTQAKLAVLAVLLTLSARRTLSQGVPSDYPYCPAVWTATDGIHWALVVFPHHGKPFQVHIKSLPSVAFSVDGYSVYGPCTPYRDQEKAGDPIKIAVCRVDLYTGEMSTVPGMTTDFPPNRKARLPDVAELSALSLTNGKPTLFSVASDGRPWRYISLSPDAQRAVAVHNGGVQLIDVIHGTAKPLDENLFIAAWSPDGKWLAGVEKGEHGRTLLMDASTLVRQRILGNSELDWSPDSKYLLGIKQPDVCKGYQGGTFQAIDIFSGARTTITNSRCQVDRVVTGWVKCDVPAR